MSKKLYTLAVACAIAFAGCGASDDETKDVGKAMDAAQPGSGSLIQARASQMMTKAEEESKVVIQNAYNRAVLMRAGIEPMGMADCSGWTDPTGACEMTCTDVDMTDGTLDIGATCSFAGQTGTCSGTTYTYGDGSFSFGMKMTSLTAASISMNMTSTVKGGNLDGKVECSFGMSFNPQVPPTGDVVGCDNFTCKYDGSEIDCEDMKENFGSCS